MRVLPLVFLVLVSFLSGCAQVAATAASTGARLGGEALFNKPTTQAGAKISDGQLAQLKQGMTRDDVQKVLQQPPTTVSSRGDGSSISTYRYNRTDRGLTAYSPGTVESQNLTVRFDSQGRYVAHDLEMSRLCGSPKGGYSAANCQDQTGAK